MSFSPALTFFLDRMQGYSTNIFKLESHAKTTAVAGDVIVFDMPSNAILSLRSFKVFFNCDANKNTTNVGARLPPVQDLFERVEVSVGGIVLSQGTNFVNVLTEAKKALEGDHTDTCMGHPEYVRAKSYINAETITPANGNEKNTMTDKDAPLFCVDRFEGFLGTAEPRLCDSSILPEIRVRIYLATDNVLSTCTTNNLGQGLDQFSDVTGDANGSGPNKSKNPKPNAKYELRNIHATIECIGLADQTYDNMISSMMSQQGFLEMPYKSYDLFQDTHSGSSRFTVSTQSLDRVWVAWRDKNYNTQDTPITVEGHITANTTQYAAFAGARLSADATGASATILFAAGISPGTAVPAEGDFVQADNSTSGTTFATIQSVNADGSITLNSAIIAVIESVITFFRPSALPTFDVGGVLDTNSEKYKGRYFNFVEPMRYKAAAGSGLKWTAQLQLNGAYYPQFQATLPQLYQISKNSIQSRKCKTMSMRQYQKNYCVQCFRLNLVDSEQQRLISGLDTRSVNLQGILSTNQTNGNDNVCIFTESTATLRIGAGRSVEILN